MDIIYNKMISNNKTNKNDIDLHNFVNQSKKNSRNNITVNCRMVNLNNSKENKTLTSTIKTNKSSVKSLKTYIALKKSVNKKGNIMRNSTSRNGVTFINFYSNASELENSTSLNKDIRKINKKEKKCNKTDIIERDRFLSFKEKTQNGAKN